MPRPDQSYSERVPQSVPQSLWTRGVGWGARYRRLLFRDGHS